MSTHARGYLMANNLNYAAFDSMVATNIQHCLTRENIEIIELMADMAQRHGYKAETKALIHQICDQAITAQQLNQRSRIKEAAAVTDLNCVSAYFAQFTIDEDPELMAFIVTGKAFGKATCKWGEFLYNSVTDDGVTLRKLASDTAALGKCLGYAAAELHEHSSFAYLVDDTRDFIDDVKEFCTDGTFSSRERRAAMRDKRNELAMKNIKIAAINASINVIHDMQNKSLEDNVAGIAEAAFDVWLTGKAIQGAGRLLGKLGQNISLAGESMYDLLPAELMDEIITYAKTPAGDIVAISEKTGINLGVAACNQVIANRAAQIEQFREQTALVINEINQTFKSSNELTVAFEKQIGKYFNFNKIAEVDSLSTIKNVTRVEEFRKHTNNFTNLEKLKPEENLYLNLCDWLEPQATAINSSVKLSGGRHFVDSATGATGYFEGYNLHHSLLGEMAPNALANRTSGGHLMIPELRAATLKMQNITPFGEGFFDMEIQYAGKESIKFKDNSYFPAGTTVQQAVDMVEKAIANPKWIRYMVDKITNKIVSFVVQDQAGNFFTVYLEKNIASFHPTNPAAIKHLL